MASLRALAPGVAFLAAVGVLARAVGSVAPVHPLLAAVVGGAVVANTVGVPSVFEDGVGTYKLWLEVGIVLMGARVSVDAVVGSGPALVATAVAAVALSLVVVEGLSRSVFGLHERLGSLLAAGASVCGVSAVVGVAGAIRADERHVAYATSTILAFDAVTLFAYPAVGHLLDLPGRAFGVWAGVSMFSTGPVTAAGFAHSEVAGQWATMAKLVRNALLGALVVGYSIAYADAGSEGASLRRLWDGVPKFVVGFAALAALASSGALADPALARIEAASGWAFLAAFAGLGTSVELRELRQTGLRPVALVGAALLAVSAAALAVVRVAF